MCLLKLSTGLRAQFRTDQTRIQDPALQQRHAKGVNPETPVVTPGKMLETASNVALVLRDISRERRMQSPFH